MVNISNFWLFEYRQQKNQSINSDANNYLYLKHHQIIFILDKMAEI